MVFKDMTFCVSKDCLQQEECQRHISKCNVRNGTLVSMADFTDTCNNSKETCNKASDDAVNANIEVEDA